MSNGLVASMNAMRGDQGLNTVLSRSGQIAEQNFTGQQTEDESKRMDKQILLSRLSNAIDTLKCLLEERLRGRRVAFSECFSLAPFANSTPRGRGKIERVLYVLHRSVGLIRRGEFISLRQLYYESELFRSQRISDDAVVLACAFVGLPRYKLGFLASHSGYLFGGSPQTRDSDGVYHGLYYRTQLNPAWKLIKQPLEINDEFAFADGLEFKSTRPIRSIVVVEKETIFRQLRTELFCEKTSSIIITGGGQPSVAARACLFYIRRDVPRIAGTFGVCDYNPSGFYIMQSWMYSTPIWNELAKLEDYKLSCVTLKVIGLRARHVRENDRRRPHAVVKKKFTDLDRSKMRKLKERLTKKGKVDFVREIELMEQYGHSIELDHINYITLACLIQQAILRKQYLL